jgi:hypothetical protein
VHQTAAETDDDEGDEELEATEYNDPEWCLENMVALRLFLLLFHSNLLINSISDSVKPREIIAESQEKCSSREAGRMIYGAPFFLGGKHNSLIAWRKQDQLRSLTA